MKSLQLTEDERYDVGKIVDMPERPEYPYGTRICLTKAELEKLGIDVTAISVSDTMMLHSIAKVTSINCSEYEGGEGDCRVELQITDMEIDTGSGKKPESRKPKLIYSA